MIGETAADEHRPGYLMRHSLARPVGAGDHSFERIDRFSRQFACFGHVDSQQTRLQGAHDMFDRDMSTASGDPRFHCFPGGPTIARADLSADRRRRAAGADRRRWSRLRLNRATQPSRSSSHPCWAWRSSLSRQGGAERLGQLLAGCDRETAQEQRATPRL